MHFGRSDGSGGSVSFDVAPLFGHIEHRGHAHGDVELKVAMYEPRLRVVGDEPDDGPSNPRHLHRVLEQRVHQVVAPHVLG